MTTAFLGLGSNLGDRYAHLARALRLLAADPAISIVLGSSVYESKPVGVIDQPDFLNLVVQVDTAHPAPDLLAACLGVEASLGRVRRERWGPRVIDVDLLTYGQLCLREDCLVLPHPRMLERGFVLSPLAEIAPGLHLGDQTVRDHAGRIGTAGLVRGVPWTEIALAAGLASHPDPIP